MRVLADRHHADLWESLAILFTDRFGWELYTPVGLEWWEAGYWRFGEVWGDDRLAQQYLVTNETWREVEPGLFLTFDQHHPERPIYGVTVDRAKAMEWDYAVASVQENQRGFRKFADDGHDAKYVYQVGNTRQDIAWGYEPLVLNASEAQLHGRARGVDMGQEFDADGIFRYRPPTEQNRIASFVNLIPRIPEVWAFWEELKAALPEYRFRSFGHDCPDGLLKPVAAIADEMARSGWAFQDKPTGDGFGHIIHNWAAIGRPLIGHARYYAGQLAEHFWQDGDTCVDLDKHSPAEAADIIRSTSPERHADLCANIRWVFDQSIDFEADAGRVRELLR